MLIDQVVFNKLGQYFFDDMSVDVRKSKIAPLEFVGKAFVIDPE